MPPIIESFPSTKGTSDAVIYTGKGNPILSIGTVSKIKFDALAEVYRVVDPEPSSDSLYVVNARESP